MSSFVYQQLPHSHPVYKITGPILHDYCLGKSYTRRQCWTSCQIQTWHDSPMAQPDAAVDSEESTTVSSEKSKRGLDLFWEGTSRKARYRYWLHFGIYVVLLSTVVWPVFSVFNRIEPYVLGLPFNMFWVTLVLVFITINSYLLYRFDEGKLLGGS